MKTTLQANDYVTLSVSDGIVVADITQNVSAGEYRRLLIKMKKVAAEHNITRLLANAKAVDLSLQTTTEKHDIGLAAADVLGSKYRCACIIQKEFINKHSENVAINRGADVLVTSTLEEALAWLNRPAA